MATPSTGIPLEQQYRQGLELLEAGNGREGLEHLSRAYQADPQCARFRAGYALGLALVKGQFLGAIELARAAVRQECQNPDLYLTLARIYLAFNFKAEAIRHLRRGLMVDPTNERLANALAGLGRRQRPALPFLPREHLLNRLLGRIQARLSSRRSAFDAAPAQGA